MWLSDRSGLMSMLTGNASQSVVSGGDKDSKPKLWGHTQDWLQLLGELLEDPSSIATAGTSELSSRTYVELLEMGRGPLFVLPAPPLPLLLYYRFPLPPATAPRTLAIIIIARHEILPPPSPAPALALHASAGAGCESKNPGSQE